MDNDMRIAVLITCYNRVSVTLRGIESLARALDGVHRVAYELFVVDDGSRDETSAEVLRAFPGAHLAAGDGTLFWNGGMRRAYQMARSRGSYDGYLLFNDDVAVDARAARVFFDEFRSLSLRGPCVLAAATLQEGGGVSYSGFCRKSRFRPLSLERLAVAGAPRVCDTFNGNFVLVPGAFFERIGGLDGNFVHAYGDIDLGYVAAKNGVQPYVCSTPIGVCAGNPQSAVQGGFPRRALQLICGSWVKRDSLRQRLYFLRKHSPWPALILSVPLTIIRFSANRLLNRFL